MSSVWVLALHPVDEVLAAYELIGAMAKQNNRPNTDKSLNCLIVFMIIPFQLFLYIKYSLKT